MEVAVSDVLHDDQFKQRHLIGNFRQMGWHLSKKRLDTGACGVKNDGPRCGDPSIA